MICDGNLTVRFGPHLLNCERGKQKYLSSVDEKVEASKSSMNQKQTRLKELQQLMEDAKTFS